MRNGKLNRIRSLLWSLTSMNVEWQMEKNEGKQNILSGRNDWLEPRIEALILDGKMQHFALIKITIIIHFIYIQHKAPTYFLHSNSMSAGLRDSGCPKITQLHFTLREAQKS